MLLLLAVPDGFEARSTKEPKGSFLEPIPVPPPTPALPIFRSEGPPRFGLLLVLALMPLLILLVLLKPPPETLPEAPQFIPELVAVVLGKESATFPMENELLFEAGVALFKGTLVLVLILPPPIAELTKSPNRLGFLLTTPIGVLETDGTVEAQLLPKISPTMEVGAFRGVWAGAGWWVHEVLLGVCQAGLDGCDAVEKDDVLFFWSLSDLGRLDPRPRSKSKLEFMVWRAKF